MEKDWKRYERVAAQLIDMMKAALGIEAVDGPTSLPGKSGTSWAIDVVARRIGGGTVIMECRRKRKRLVQEAVAAVAYRIHDTGSFGGITVSPEPLQAGASLVAEAEGIEHIELNAEATATDYVMRLLGKCFIGVSVQVQAHARVEVSAVVIRGGKEVP